MSMPSPGLRISFWDHSCSPVAALSANAFELVAPYTVVPTTLTPSGPMFGELYALCQSSLPVLILIAHTPDPRSWKYATPPTITGVAAKAPKPTPSLPVIGTFQATPSLETLDDVMDDTTSRVPARLPLGCVQAAAAAAGAGGVGVGGGGGAAVVAAAVDELVGAAVDADVVDDEDFLELPPQPASNPTAAMSA